MDAVITAIWTAIDNLCNGIYAYLLGELKKAGDASMKAQSES